MVGIESFPLKVWPFSNIVGFLTVNKARAEKKELIPNTDVKPLPTGILDILNRMLGMVPIIVMVYFIDKIYPIAQQMKDAEDHPWDFSLNGWIFKIFLRDMIFNMVLIATWFWLMDCSSLKDVMQPLRFNQERPSKDELYREVPYAISTVLMGLMFEVSALHLYANGTITNYYMDIFESRKTILVTCAWVFLCPSWRDGHFYWIHRFIHPWNTVWIPDLGHYLFEYGHYLHHQSTNFTAWSGISMHPIEGFVYESACLVPCLFFHHPILIWLIKIDLTYKAILGHDGYDYPGQGGWDHYIHHTKFNCNYGTSNAPFDWLFGSFDDGAAEWKQMCEEQRKVKKN